MGAPWPWPPPDTTEWTPADWAQARARYWGTWPWCHRYPAPDLWADLPAGATETGPGAPNGSAPDMDTTRRLA
jgi:hypothetical protein